MKKEISNMDLGLEEISKEEYDPEFERIILDRVLKSYDNKDEVHRTQYHLQESIRYGAIICLICIDNAKKNDQIWNCEVCYSCFHLTCILKWAKDSIFLQSQAVEENEGIRCSQQSFTWSCPKCRFEYPKSKTPDDYRCFCGKVVDPPFDPWLIPHSCGGICMKDLRPLCGHTCTLLCHPGPCPPCPVMIRASCFCDSSSATKRCSSKKWSCQKVCGKLLECKQHKCKSLCHDGHCPTCPHVSQRRCQCGTSTQMRPCAELKWQCEKVCMIAYSCGNHTCSKICHEGDCGECPLSLERACPCGKQVSTLPCTEIIPSCGDTCLKPLSCGKHLCAERCHRGPCPQCLQYSIKKCQCGLREKELPCSKPFICEVKCKRMRDCKKHACNRKCCSGGCPSCEHPCGKTLRCGQHKCESRCHRGDCFPCSVTHTIYCVCKKTSIAVPCGRERKTPLPRCDAECQKVSTCHHKTKGCHKCHEGKCSSCKLECSLVLECGHKCPLACHDEVPLKICENQRLIGPWERRGPSMKISKLPCSPCKVRVPGICFGKHETTEWFCSELRPHSCSQKCGRLLICGNHSCELECHVVEGAKNEIAQGINCKPCHLGCLKERPNGCSHPCKVPCHPGDCPQCEENVHTLCHCGLLKLVFSCHAWLLADGAVKEKMKSCGNQCNKIIECGHKCQKVCHGDECTPVQECRMKVTVRCPCKRLRREFPCHNRKTQLECDFTCLEIVQRRNKISTEQKEKQKREEEERMKKELEEFENFMSGKKRRRRKGETIPVSTPQRWGNRFLFSFALASVAFSIFIYLIVGK